MDRYTKLTNQGYEYVYCDYAHYNDDIKDRQLFKDIAILKGYTDPKVYRAKTDTQGLKMYEVYGRRQQVSE